MPTNVENHLSDLSIKGFKRKCQSAIGIGKGTLKACLLPIFFNNSWKPGVGIIETMVDPGQVDAFGQWEKQVVNFAPANDKNFAVALA